MVETASIGPWSGGLNLTSNRDLSPYLDNNELGAALNVQFTREGFVESRPGFKVLPSNALNAESQTVKVIGSIYAEDQEIAVVQVKTLTRVTIYYVTGAKVAYFKYAFTDLTLDFSSVLAINNYADELGAESPRGVFLFDSISANKCYRLEEYPKITTTVSAPVLMSSVLKVPKSHFSFSLKDRVFLVDADISKLYWSALGTNSLFFDNKELNTDRGKETGFQFMDPSLDLTDRIQAVEFVNNSFYLFKKSSTFMYTYQVIPEDDGYMRKISDTLGALDSTMFRNTIIVINNQGIYSVEGTEFINLQTKLNLRFENYIDVVNPKAFVTSMGTNIIVGYISNGKAYYYVMNGDTKGWSQWDFSYADVPLASPGSNAVLCRHTTDQGIVLFHTFDRKNIVYANWQPDIKAGSLYDYAEDSSLFTDNSTDNITRYIPKITLYTKAILGDSLLNFKKLYRSYIRMYLSDYPGVQWKLSINYNEYKFDPTMNPMFILITAVDRDELVPVGPIVNTVAAVYKRTYQIPFAQQRAVEFVYEMTRPYTKLIDTRVVNPSPDRPIHQGFYFLLSGLWVDYDNRARI